MSTDIIEFMQEIHPGVPLDAALSLHDKCQQDRVWFTRDKQKVFVATMEMSHVRNLVQWLEARAGIIKVAADTYWMHEVSHHDGGEQAHLSLEHIEEEVTEMDAQSYLCSTPLYRALTERIRIDDGGDPRPDNDPSWDQPYN